MRLTSIVLRLIEEPLNEPFVTHLKTVKNRRAIIVEARDGEGTVGYGECDPFSSPWYTEETIETNRHMLKEFLIPPLLGRTMADPSAVGRIWSGIRGNRMAKSGLSQAIWDLWAKRKGVYLGHLFGGEKQMVTAGAVIATESAERAVKQIERLLEAGYRSFKVKISRRNDRRLLKAIRSHFPQLDLSADANAAYSPDDLDRLKKLDEFRLRLIEQPLAPGDLLDHAYLQQKLSTPICLDESIRGWQSVRAAAALGSCQAVNVKMARVGGWTEAARIQQWCKIEGIPIRCGGMVEFGVAKAHNIALSTLAGFTLPGDLYGSSHYWAQDIVCPEIRVNGGSIRVPSNPGIGFAVDRQALEALTLHRLNFR